MSMCCLQKVRGMALDDVVVLNVDTNTLETPYDDLQSLPNDVVRNHSQLLKENSPEETCVSESLKNIILFSTLFFLLKSSDHSLHLYLNVLKISPADQMALELNRIGISNLSDQ